VFAIDAGFLAVVLGYSTPSGLFQRLIIETVPLLLEPHPLAQSFNQQESSNDP
jgi:hypothetical protein